jgi:hypothetical protein
VDRMGRGPILAYPLFSAFHVPRCLSRFSLPASRLPSPPPTPQPHSEGRTWTVDLAEVEVATVENDERGVPDIISVSPGDERRRSSHHLGRPGPSRRSLAAIRWLARPDAVARLAAHRQPGVLSPRPES